MARAMISVLPHIDANVMTALLVGSCAHHL
jgi:hypothetical protein